MAFDFAARSRQFHDALYEGLDAADSANVLDNLAQLVGRARTVAGGHEHVVEALDALRAIAGREDVDEALSEAAALFASPQRFREALYFVRCLDHESASALMLMQTRGYVEAATVPVAIDAALATGQAAFLDGATFATLWREPGLLRSMVDVAEAWRTEYVAIYQRAHAAYNEAIAGIGQSAEAMQVEVELLERLNHLRKLGGPLAEAGLLRMHEFEQVYACPANDGHLSDTLMSAPVCDQCGFRLGDVAPLEAAEQVESEIDGALATQIARLDQRVVSRLRGRPAALNGDRVGRLVAAVEARDFKGVARALDEGLLGFVEDLLDTPEPRVNLIERLAREHPEVTAGNLDAVVASFRRIATEEVDRAGGRLRIGVEEEPA